RENPHAEGIGRLADPGRGLEVILGKSQIGAVQKGQHVHQEQPGQQVPHGLVRGAAGGGVQKLHQTFSRSRSSRVKPRPKPGPSLGTSTQSFGTAWPGNGVTSDSGTPGGLPRKNSPQGMLGMA